MVPYSLQKPQHPKRVRQDLTFPVDIQSDFSTHFRQVALMLEDDFVIFKPSFNKLGVLCFQFWFPIYISC